MGVIATCACNVGVGHRITHVSHSITLHCTRCFNSSHKNGIIAYQTLGRRRTFTRFHRKHTASWSDTSLRWLEFSQIYISADGIITDVEAKTLYIESHCSEPYTYGYVFTKPDNSLSQTIVCPTLGRNFAANFHLNSLLGEENIKFLGCADRSVGIKEYLPTSILYSFPFWRKHMKICCHMWEKSFRSLVKRFFFFVWLGTWSIGGLLLDDHYKAWNDWMKALPNGS